MPKQEISSKLGYSWGDVTIKVGLEGSKFDQPQRILDHMMTTAISTVGLETVQYAICECATNSGGTQEEFEESVKAGDIKVHTTITFNSSRHISKRTLNSIMFGAVLPNLQKTAALYIGDNKWEATPSAPLQDRPHAETLHDLEASLHLSHPARTHTATYDRELVGATA